MKMEQSCFPQNFSL